MIYAIALFIVVIAAELYLSRKTGKNVYQFNESASHFLLGIGQQVINLFLISGLALIYNRIFELNHWFNFSEKVVLHWFIVFLISDLAYYLAHRAMHRVNFFVASHSVHHQARDFNHASALRQSWTTRPFIFVFYVPLALLGIPVKMLLITQLINTVIQFFSHNGLITRHLGTIEKIMVTPRSHRVHHGSNAPYLDKNYAGVLIIWDRLFGTYQDLDESIPLIIGPTDGKNYYNPFYANLDYFQKLWMGMEMCRGLKKIGLLFGTPEALDEIIATRDRTLSSSTIYNLMESRSPSLRTFFLMTTTSFLMVLPFIAYFNEMELGLKIAGFSVILTMLFLAGKQLRLKQTTA